VTVVERPNPATHEQHLCLDKGYDNPTGHTTVAAKAYTSHIRRIGEEKLDPRRRKTRPARRWVVERTLAWLSKCRAILVRHAKKARNDLAMVQLACVLLWYRRLHRISGLR
jgi:putative transposase